MSSAPTLLHTVFTITASSEEYDTEYDVTTDIHAARNHDWLFDYHHLVDPTSSVMVRRIDVFSDGTATNELFMEATVRYSFQNRAEEYWMDDVSKGRHYKFVPKNQ